jgi:D-alanyl-D-alanine carboxypeptidase
MQRKEFFVALALFAAVVIVAAAVALPGYSQGQSNPAPEGGRRDGQASAQPLAAGDVPGRVAAERTKAAERLSDAAATATNEIATAAGAEFAAAARQNAVLRGGLDWVFGGKQQRGWALYQPLIASTLAVEAGADSNDFASAVSRWQKSLGLQPSGVLDRGSWMKLVETWQANRLKVRGYPSDDQLVNVPAAEFYDPARPAELRRVERETYAAYRRMLAAAAADKSLGLRLDANGELAPEEKFLKIVSAYRSKAYQDRLRRLEPGAGRAALAVHSPHFTGRALDLYVGGYDPVSTKDDNRLLQTQTKAYRWLVRHAESFGFRPYYYEPWHWEYVGR